MFGDIPFGARASTNHNGSVAKRQRRKPESVTCVGTGASRSGTPGESEMDARTRKQGLSIVEAANTALLIQYAHTRLLKAHARIEGILNTIHTVSP